MVLIIPRMLRIFFKFRGKFLGELSRSAVRTPTVYFKAVTGEELVAGVFVAVQTFGDRINFRPPRHFLVTERVIDRIIRHLVPPAHAFDKVALFAAEEREEYE
jgi:hypothetical protein